MGLRLTVAQREMVEANMGIAGMVAAWYRHRTRDPSAYEDLRSIACLSLCEAAQRFDATLGFTFATYAARCCRNAIVRELRDGGVIRTHRNPLARERVRGARIGPGGLADCIDPHPAVDPAYQAELHGLRDRIAELPARERWASERSLEGWTGEEIGRALGCTKANANIILAAARRRLHESYPETEDNR